MYNQYVECDEFFDTNVTVFILSRLELTYHQQII
jgi:hypothetical protein